MTNEWHDQRSIIAWFKAEWPEHERALRVSMNGLNLGGGRKAAIMISQMKAQGMIEGESDIAVMLPRQGFGSLILELKAVDTAYTVTGKQEAYLDYHRDIGNYARMARGVDEAQKIIEAYMSEGELDAGLQ